MTTLATACISTRAVPDEVLLADLLEDTADRSAWYLSSEDLLVSEDPPAAAQTSTSHSWPGIRHNSLSTFDTWTDLNEPLPSDERLLGMLAVVFGRLSENQRELGPVEKAVLYGNLWELYE